jgi:hypothetical protein
MAEVDYTAREVRFRFAIFGQPGAGKRTVLRQLHAAFPPGERGGISDEELGSGRVLSFEFTPRDLVPLAEYGARGRVVTLTAPMTEAALYGRHCADLDALLCVADTRRSRLDGNIATLQALGTFRFLREVPVVFFYNRWEGEEALPIEALNAQLNPLGAQHHAGDALTGAGMEAVVPALISAAMANAA